MIIQNLQHNLLTIYGASISVDLDATAGPLGIHVPACDGVWIQGFGDTWAFTTDGRTPVIDSVGKTLKVGDSLTIAPEDLQHMIAISNGVSKLDIDFLTTRG